MNRLKAFNQVLTSSIGCRLIVCLTGIVWAGCYSMHTASSPTLSACRLAVDGSEIVEHVFIQNSGWFLCDRLPLVCGNPDETSWFPWVFFKDVTNLPAVERKLAERARMCEVRVVHECLVDNASTLMSIPTLDIALPYLLCRHETQVSALLVKSRHDGKDVK